jgi:hypothetical protein
MSTQSPTDKITYIDFAKSIKDKYPQYADKDDYELAEAMINKYPEYKDKVDLKKKDDTSNGLPIVSESELEAPSTPTEENFLKQQLDLQEPAFSTAISKAQQERDIPEQKPMSMETFEDIMADVEVEKQKKIQTEEDKKLFEEFEEARAKIHKEERKEKFKEELKAEGIIKKPSKELKEKFEAGELQQADFFPDGNYFYGYLKNVNRSTESFLRKINGAEKLVSKGLNIASFGAIPETEGAMGIVADWVNEKVVKGLPETPEDVVGGVVNQLGQMNMFPTELMLTPQAKIKALSTITGGLINGIPKLPILLGVGGGLEEYSRTEDTKESLVRGVQGFSDGVFLTLLGNVAGKTGMVAAKNPMNQQLLSTGINAVGFGGKSAYEQKITTGEIDPVEVASQATFAAVLSAPEIAKMAETYFTSSKNTIRSVENMKVDYNKLTKEYKKLVKEERTEGITPEKRAEIEIAKQGMQNFISMKFAIDDVKRNPNKYREIVERDKTLNEQEKQFQLDKIDYIEKTVKEIKPKDVKEGISEPLESTEIEKPKETIPEKKEAVKTDKIKPKEKEIKDGVQEITQEVKEKGVQKEVTKEELQVKREEFKKDFLSDDINLENIDVPLKMKDKIAAAKNLREGKETAQGKILEEYLDKAFEKGTLDLITADKKTRVGAPIEDIAKPKKEAPESVEAKKVKIPEKELDKMKAEEKGKPDEYQTLGEKGSSDQEKLTIKLGIDKNNNIDLTKTGSKKEKNKLIKKKAKELNRQIIEGANKGVKKEISNQQRNIALETFETNLYTQDLEKKFSKEQREAITFLLEKKGIPEKMVSGKVKDAHDNPTPEMKQAVKEIQGRYDKAWKYIVENTDKMSAEQIKDYVTHLWKIPDQKVSDVVKWFTTKNRFTKKRSIESIKEGMEKFGLKPQTTDIAEILRVYDSARINAVENQKMVDAIKKMKIEGVPMLLKQHQAPSDWKEITHPSLTYKTFVPSKKEGQPATIHKSYYKVHPDIHKTLNVVMDSGVFKNITFDNAMRSYENISGILKKINLSLSLFHHTALSETLIPTVDLPKALKTFGKDLIWDGLTGKGKPAFKNPELTRDAINYRIQIGVTQDIPVAEIAKGLDKLAEKAKGIPGAEQLAKGLAKGNELWDKMLWDYLHDGYKLYAWQHKSNQIRTKSLEKGWNKEETDKRLYQAAEMINDTFGGQNWTEMGVSKTMQRVYSWALLSPDWTISTIRQALSPLGVGSMYKNDKYIRLSDTKKIGLSAYRAKIGTAFWLKAGIYSTIGMNLFNVMNRLDDEKENPELPLYKKNKDKPLKDKIIPYSMYGNTLGHKSHIFYGRYEDGMEKNLRFGKQFREMPELFMDNEGISFPKPLLKKLGGKANPLLQYGVQLATGHTLSGFENWDLKDKKGWEWTKGALKTTGKAAFPYSTATVFRDDKEFSLTDLALPSSKGMTPSGAISLFEKGLSFENGFDYDVKYIEEVYQGAIMNKLDALSLFKIAARNKEAEATFALKEGLKSVKDIQAKIKETKNPTERDKLYKAMDKLIDRNDRIRQARLDFIEVDDYLKDKEFEYLEINE